MQRPASSRPSPPAPRKPNFPAGADSGRNASFSEFALHSATVCLAIASTAFAAHMIATPDRVPTFAGAEHLMIFARPSAVAARRNQENPALLAANRNGVDYTPVGRLDDKSSSADLAQYEVVEANEAAAVLKAPRGSILRVAKGDYVVGIGKILRIARQNKLWVVVTTQGVITARPDSTAPNGAARN
jgi:hypothetical protein